MADRLVDLYCLDSTPGANSVFAPPAGWEGNEQEYLELLRWRYKYDLQSIQQIDTIARRMQSSLVRAEIALKGPFAHLIRTIMNGVIAKRRKAAAEEAAAEMKRKTSA